MIEVKNLKKHFGTNEVLRGIDQHISKGEVVAVMVPRARARAHFCAALISSKRQVKAKFMLTASSLTHRKPTSTR